MGDAEAKMTIIDYGSSFFGIFVPSCMESNSFSKCLGTRGAMGVLYERDL